jgi:hypothetical protein
VPEPALAFLGLPGGVPRIAIDTGGFEPAVFAAHYGYGDSSGWPAVAAIAELRPGTRDCNSGLEDGWDERASHIP